MAKALLVIDVNCFFLKNTPQGFADRIARYIKSNRYDCVAFTVFKNQPDSNFVKSLNWTKCRTEEDARLPDVLQKYVGKNNVFKRAAFSGFTQTLLDDYLRQKDVEEITICGIDTDACVLATAFNAFDLGYLVSVEFSLSYSGNNLGSEAEAIINQSIVPQDKFKQ